MDNNENILSVFVDESGDSGEYNVSAGIIKILPREPLIMIALTFLKDAIPKD